MATRTWAEDPPLGYPSLTSTFPFAAELNPRGQRSFVLTAPLLNGDDAPIILVNGEVSFDVSGTFGAGGSVAVEGSNDPTNPASWGALHNDAGTAIAITVAGVHRPVEKVYAARLRVTAGDGTTSLTCRARVTAAL